MNVTALAMQISLVAFMIGSLAGVGLGVAPRDVLAPLTHGRFVLLALAPCAPFAPAMMRKAGGDPAYVAAFMVLTAVVPSSSCRSASRCWFQARP